MKSGAMRRLLPPTEDHPAPMLRWVRGVEIALIPLGVVVALIMRAEGLDAWWLGFAVSATVVAVIVALLAGEPGLAITFAILCPLGGGLGLWLTPRIVNRG